MKTYELFVEATEADLKSMGASASQIAMLKKRQEKRGKGFSTGDDRVKKTSSSSTPKALPGSSALAKRPESRGVGSFDKPGALALRPANKATAIVKAKQKKDVDLESQVRKAPKVDKFKPKGGEDFGKEPKGDWKRSSKKEFDKQKKIDAKNKEIAKDGFGSGVKSALGGDSFRNVRDKNGQIDRKKLKQRTAARKEAGKKFGNFVKSVPGKALGTAKGVASKVLGSDTSVDVKTAQSSDLKGAKRGIYNPK